MVVNTYNYLDTYGERRLALLPSVDGWMDGWMQLVDDIMMIK
jgi:hypothetical protein